MEIKDTVSKDVWESIKDSYERGSYTGAITCLVQDANEIVREKSNLSLDNTKLMDAAFLGNNPKLKINKYQTQTEKDIQSGIGYLLKGACLAIRNPRAHGKYKDDKNTADVIILFLNYVIGFIKDSKQPNLIDDWIEFVFDENFNNTEKYAKILVAEIPEKKRYDVLVNIFRNRKEANSGNLNSLVKVLLNSIKSDEYKEFIDNINKELLFCSDDAELRKFFSLYTPSKWNELIPLTKHKIENMVKNSILNGKMDDVYDSGETEYKCNSKGSLSTWTVSYVSMFENFNEILNVLGNKLGSEDIDERNFVFKYFSEIAFGEQATKHSTLKYGITKSLKYYDKETFKSFELDILFNNEEIIEAFGKEMEKAKQYFDDLAIKDKNEILVDFQIEDLPF